MSNEQEYPIYPDVIYQIICEACEKTFKIEGKDMTVKEEGERVIGTAQHPDPECDGEGTHIFA